MTAPWDFEWDDWVEPAHPMVGPAFDWSTVEYITIHYPGNPKVLLLGVERERDEIRREQRDYTDNRGYSVGYNAKVFQNGHRWKLRGDVLRCAANGNQATNVRGFAIQIRVANDETPTAELIDAVRSLVAWAREQAGRHLPINGHRDIRATACPGDKAYALIRAGVFEPVEAPVVIDPPKPTPIPRGELVMKIFQPDDCDAQFMGMADGNGNVPVLVWIQTAEQQQSRDEYIANGAEVDRGPRNPKVGRSGFKNCALLGPVPHGDRYRVWTEADFFSVVG